MDPLLVLISVTVLLAVFSLVMGIRSFRPKGEGLAERLEAYRPDQGPKLGAVEERLKWRTRSYSGLPILSAFLAQFGASEKVALHLERAGVPLRVGEYYMMRYGMAVLLFMVPFIFNQTILSLVFGLGLAIVGYMLPAIYIGSKRKGRAAQINAQLVELLGLVSNSLKTGYGLMQSLEFAARQLAPPMSVELKRMLRDVNLGLSAEDALTALGERVDSSDLDMVLTAVNVQRAVGGNLSEILEKVAFTMRERERIRGEIRTLTAQQRMTGIMIGALPVGMGLLFMMINPDYMSLLFTELAGRIMLVMAVGLEILGAVTIKRVLAIEM